MGGGDGNNELKLIFSSDGKQNKSKTLLETPAHSACCMNSKWRLTEALKDVKYLCICSYSTNIKSKCSGKKKQNKRRQKLPEGLKDVFPNNKNKYSVYCSHCHSQG